MKTLLPQSAVFPDMGKLSRKISYIKSQGPERLHVITDFDRTLTMPVTPEGAHNSTWNSTMHVLGEEYACKKQELFDYYHPMWRGQDMDPAKKAELMMEWSIGNFALLVEHGMTRQSMREIVERDLVHPREGVNEFFAMLSSAGVPSLVFSAGLADIIEEYFISEGLMQPQENEGYKEVHVVGNYCIFDEEGRFVGCREPMIHSCNKNEGILNGALYADEMRKRPNVLLLGDSLEDAEMCSGIDHEAVVRVGYISEETRIYMGDYLRLFDAVIDNQFSMGYARELLEELL